jgi:hypothetical protein
LLTRSAAFGGLSYAATNKLSFGLEYSSDGYDREVRDGALNRESSINVTASVNGKAKVSQRAEQNVATFGLA